MKGIYERIKDGEPIFNKPFKENVKQKYYFYGSAETIELIQKNLDEILKKDVK